MSSNNDLLIAVFKEIAVIQGKRSPNGEWTDANPWHVQTALEVAQRVIEAAKASADETGTTDTALSTARKR